MASKPALFNTLQRRHFFQRIRETDKLREDINGFCDQFATFGFRQQAGLQVKRQRALAVQCVQHLCREGGHSPVNQLPGSHQGVNVASLTQTAPLRES